MDLERRSEDGRNFYRNMAIDTLALGLGIPISRKERRSMKFRIRLGGKDSINDGVSMAPRAAQGLPDDFDPDADAKAMRRYEAALAKLQRFVERWCENGDGGNDHVTLEFDPEAGTCVVVPVSEAKKGD